MSLQLLHKASAVRRPHDTPLPLCPSPPG
jgi:hypothetical protein